MTKEFRLAELIAAVKQVPLLTAHLVPTDCEHMLHFEAGLSQLLSHLCGEINPAEVVLAIPVVQQELIRQHPWLRGITLPHPDSWAWLWAWLDTMELKHGVMHPVHSLPADWRGSVKLSSYSTPALNLFTGEARTVTWEDLPDEVQLYLRGLGYDETP